MRTMFTLLRLIGAFVALSSVCAVSEAQTNTLPLRVGHYSLVSVTKVATNQYDYVFRAKVHNRSTTPYSALSMQLTLAPNTGGTVIKDTLNFGEVAPKRTVQSLDQFVIEFRKGTRDFREDLLERLPKILSWSVLQGGPQPVAVPNVVGLVQTDAVFAITSAGLTVGAITTASSPTVTAGSVISESPSAVTLVTLGSAVNLVISTGPATVAVPSVVGLTQAAATTAITTAGLTLGTVTQASSSTVAAGNVISETPAAGTLVALGSAVNLVISTGPVQVAVPNVVGLVQTDAVLAITNAGLTAGTVTAASSSTVAAGSVISETPAAATLVTLGSAVNLVISTGPVQVAVPNVVGLAQAAATTAITNVGLTLGTVTQASSPTVAAGNVISELPAGGTLVALGSAVNLVISTGPAQVAVPNVVGLVQTDAVFAITNAGLTAGTVTAASSSTVAAGSVISESPSAGTLVTLGSAVNLVISTGPVQVAVPNIVGLAQAAATTAITNVGLTLGTVTQVSSATVAAGNVISESPVAGTLVTLGSAVNLVISTGPAPVVVPNVVGLVQTDAVFAITNSGLTLGTVTPASSSTVAAGGVISQSPAAATLGTIGSAVNLVISTGPAQVAVPNVVGLTQAAATTAITTAGLTLGTVTQAASSTVAAGNVISESPVAGTLVTLGSAVNLVISTGPAQVAVPNVVGLVQTDAVFAITSAGLTAGTVTTASSSTVPAGSVISQAPAAATPVAPNSSVDLVISTGPANSGLPPDPATVAPTLDPTVSSSVATGTDFLYTGSNPIQTGVAPGTITLQRAAVLRGKVIGTDGLPITGAQVTILGHPEFGQTRTRADGNYDMAVNGGGLLSVRIDKSGYPPAQRQVSAPWQDFANVPDVILTAYDTRSTSIGQSTTIQVAQGTPVTDADGTRQSTLLFAPGTSMVMALPNGSGVNLSSFTVRATEFTVGANGRKAMPADLPASSGYTYAVELSVDEVVAAGATSMQFTKPVINYLENFVGFPVGSLVPVGYFDRDQGVWMPSSNGRVIKVLSTTGGVAAIDTDGTGVAADALKLTALGVTSDELTQLALLYSPGQTLWRISVTHFSLWDFNWPWGFPLDAIAPLLSQLFKDPPVNDHDLQCGSVIDCQDQSLGESVPVTGTPWRLNYRSNRTHGNKSAQSLQIALSGASALPVSLKRIDLEISVAGRNFIEHFAPASNLIYNFVFDGKDAYGRTVQGPQPVKVRIGYTYPGTYMTPTQTSSAIVYAALFGHFTYLGVPASANLQRLEATLWQEFDSQVGSWDYRAVGVDGWSLDIHHAYDPVSHTLLFGNGNQRVVDALTIGEITTVAGNGVLGCGAFNICGDGGPAIAAPLGTSNQFRPSIAVGPDRSLYIAAEAVHRVRKVSPDGIITTIAGNGTGSFSGDGGPALAATLRFPEAVALGPDGSLYIYDAGNNRIRSISRDGIITTVAGNGTAGFSGDGGPATAAQIGTRGGGIAVSQDGSLYIADTDNSRVRRVGTDGIISTVAGTADLHYSGDGGPAVAAQLDPVDIALGRDGSLYISDFGNARIRRIGNDGTITSVAGQGYAGRVPPPLGPDGGPAVGIGIGQPSGIAVAPDGGFYFAEMGNSRVRFVRSNGIISTVAGYGSAGFSGDGGPATAGQFGGRQGGMALGPDGSLYIMDATRVRRVAPVLPGVSATDIVVPSEDGREVYIFDGVGRHLQTLDALTGAVRYEFGYDANGYLVAITDGSGNVTTIERSGTVVSAIVAPGGQRTTLTVDANGWLDSAANPAGETHGMGYSADGLMQTFTDPLGNIHRFTYDALGFLVKDDDPAGGSISLARTKLSNGYSVTTTSSLGRTHTYQVEQLTTGAIRRTVTSTSGTKTVILINPDGSKQTSYADGSGTTVTYGPDPRFGMLAPVPTNVKITTPGGLTRTITTTRTATFSYVGNLVSLTNLTDTVADNGRVSTGVYSHNGTTRSIIRTTPAGRSSTVLLDDLGRVTQAQALGLDPVSYTYDARGLLTTLTEGSGLNSRTTTLIYNAAFELTSVTDALGRTLGLSYDSAGRLVTETLPDTSTVNFAYDAAGRITALAPPGRSEHDFGYTAIDQLASYTPPDVGSGSTATQYNYDTDRALTRKTRPDGQLVDVAYDAAGRVSAVTIARGAVGFSYDAANDHLTGITAPGGLGLSYSYNSDLVTGVTWSGAVAGSLGYTYDNNFRLTAESINGANAVNFSYDADGLLTIAGSLALSHTAQNGLYTGSTLGNVTDTLSHDTLAQLTGYSANFGVNGIYSTVFVRDAVGRITQKTETIGGVATVYGYGYDVVGRLTSVTKDSVLVSSYVYDSNGNRTTYTGSVGPVNASYDAQDRLTSYGATTYSYTANGELLAKSSGTQTSGYQYDALGNLLHVTLPNGTAIDYLIDGKNRRIGKKVNGVLTQGFLYKGSLRPIAELNGSNAIVSRFVYATHVNVPDYMIKGGVTYRIVTDHLGSPRLVVDVTSGTVAQRIDYDEFGRVVGDTNPGFQPFGFAGGLYDRDTGLVRFGARDYDAEVGRWTAKDPIRFAGKDGNLYSAARANPINNSDPSGLLVGAVGSSTSAGLGYGENFSHGKVIDSGGNYGSYDSLAAGLSTPGISTGVSIAVLGSSGNSSTSIQDYGGPFVNGSACFSVGPGISLDIFVDPTNIDHWGAGLTFSIGTPGGGGFAGVSDTVVRSVGNINTDFWDFLSSPLSPLPSFSGFFGGW